MLQMKSARDSAKQTVLGCLCIIYSSEKDVSAQDYEAHHWKQLMKEGN